MKHTSTARLDDLAARVEALRGAAPPTYAEFVELWGRMDGLSHSLYETALACPEIVGASGPYWEAVRGHLERMGVPAPEPFTITDVLEGLTSD